jgi:hypothetical protein
VEGDRAAGDDQERGFGECHDDIAVIHHHHVVVGDKARLLGSPGDVRAASPPTASVYCSSTRRRGNRRTP